MTEESKPAASKGTGVVCLALIAGVVVFGTATCSAGKNTGNDRPNGGAQIVACKHAVKAQLANPETADFQITTMSQTYTRITGDVIAETGFGAKKRMSYDCSMSGETVSNATVREVG